MSEPRVTTCDDCGHLFDQRDERAFVRGGHSVCPACQMMERGARAWAVHNDCQGVFSCAVRYSKEEAEELAAQRPYASAGCDVRSVRIILERD